MSELQYDAHQQVVDVIYQQIAPQYDQLMRGFGWPADGMLEDVVNTIGQGREVLDLGAGTGLSTQALIAAGVKHVTAVDASTAMLDRLRNKFSPDDTRVEVVRSTAEQY